MLGLCGDRGGVVADGNKVVAQGQGSTDHPLAHTAMVLADLVARSQGGGAWAFTNSPALSFTPAEELHSSAISAAPSSGPYLCTGYTVYLARWVSSAEIWPDMTSQFQGALSHVCDGALAQQGGASGVQKTEQGRSPGDNRQTSGEGRNQS